MEHRHDHRLALDPSHEPDDDELPVPGRPPRSRPRSRVPGRGSLEDASAAPGDDRAASGGIPGRVRHRMEQFFGMDFSGVRLREDAGAAQVEALAYARGDEIVVAPGRLDLGSDAGLAMLAHELTHVVQQREGRVARAAPGGSPINSDAALEAEAEQRAVEWLRSPAPVHGGVALRSAPSRTAVDAPIQRMKIVATQVQRPAPDALLAMTIEELERFADAQVDWHADPALAAVHAVLGARCDQIVRDVLLVVRNQGHASAGCRRMTVRDVWPALSDGRRAHLMRYCRAVTGEDTTVRIIDPTADVARAVTLGEALDTLAPIGGAVLQTCVPQRQLEALVDHPGAVAGFVQFVHDCRPTLHARTGDEVRSFLRLFGRVDLRQVQQDLRWVRNVHRFTETTLQQLQRNMTGGPRGRRVTVLVHSTFDSNGAYHGDQQLRDAIRHDENFAVVVEGGESLAAVSNMLDEVRQEFGYFDQVMLLGHGQGRHMEMAGRVDEHHGALRKTEDAIDPQGNADHTRAFLERLAGNLRDGARVVLNACRTGANELSPQAVANLPADEHAAAQQILRAIRDNPRLVDQVQAVLERQDVRDPEVIGARGSFSSAKLVDDGGRLTLDRKEDPALTSSRLAYVEQGADATGVLWATLECWARDRRACANAIRYRLERDRGQSWDAAIVRVLFELITTVWDSGADVADLVELANPLTRCDSADAVRDDTIATLFQTVGHRFRDRIYAALLGAPNLGPHQRVVFNQLWLVSDNRRLQPLLDAVAGYTCNQITRYPILSLRFLSDRGWLARILDPARALQPDRARLIMALVGAGARPAVPACVTFLQAVMGNRRGSFPDQLNIGELLGGYRSSRTILAAIGRDQVQDDARANLSLGGGHNTAYVRPMTRQAVVGPGGAAVHDRLEVPGDAMDFDDGHDQRVPQRHALQLGFPANHPLVVLGQLDDADGGHWYAVEWGNQTAFVPQASVALL